MASWIIERTLGSVPEHLRPNALVQMDGRASAAEARAAGCVQTAPVARERPENRLSSGCRSWIHLGFPVLEPLPAGSASFSGEMGAGDLCGLELAGHEGGGRPSPRSSMHWRRVMGSPHCDFLSTEMLVPSLAHGLGLPGFNLLVTVLQFGAWTWLVPTPPAPRPAPVFLRRSLGSLPSSPDQGITFLHT